MSGVVHNITAVSWWMKKEQNYNGYGLSGKPTVVATENSGDGDFLTFSFIYVLFHFFYELIVWTIIGLLN